MDMQFQHRRTGQNTRMVIFSSAQKRPIVCRKQEDIDTLLYVAERLGIDIPQPLLAKDINWYNRKVILHDNFENIE